MVSVALPACKSAVPRRVPPATNATVPVGLNWGRLRSATLAVRMTGRPSAVDPGLIERNVRVDTGLEPGEEAASFGAGRGGAAGFGVAGRVEVGVDVGLGAEVDVGLGAEVDVGVGVGDGVGVGVGDGVGVGVGVGDGLATPERTPIEDVPGSANQMLPPLPIVSPNGLELVMLVEKFWTTPAVVI
jgi:hypothetical protein